MSALQYAFKCGIVSVDVFEEVNFAVLLDDASERARRCEEAIARRVYEIFKSRNRVDLA
jgi:hypothetical protein